MVKPSLMKAITALLQFNTDCRNFVLPMNPQRTELECAIRLALRKIGVSIRPMATVEIENKKEPRMRSSRRGRKRITNKH